MALRAKVRGQWRNVSPAMARVFRARGVTVVDTEAKAAAFVITHEGPRVEFDTPAQAREKAAAAPFDLSDDELERLTAPGGE